MPNTPPPLIKLKPLDFKKGLLVVNRSRKYVVHLDNTESEKLVVSSPKSTTPESLDDYHGLVFYNAKDSVWQCASGARKQTVIINDISPEQASLLYAKQVELSGPAPALNLEQARELLIFAQNELKADDLYYKGASTVARDMEVIDPAIPQYVKVTTPQQYKAIFLEGEFVYQGPVKQCYRDGAIIVFDGKHSWAVETQVFLDNYRAVVGNQERRLGSLTNDFSLKGRRLNSAAIVPLT